MTNLLSRIKNVIIADLNEVVDQKEQKNPIAMLNHYLRQCEQETEKVRKLLERQYQLKDQLTKEYDQASELADKRQHQADIALKAGEHELHQFASEEHRHYAGRTERLKATLEQITSELSTLETKYQEMNHKLKDMQLRRMELMGRENAARANHRMDQVIDFGSTNKAQSQFKDIENYLDRLEHQVNRSYYRSTIDARIAELEKQMKLDESKSI